MTENEWNLTKDNLMLRKELIEVQSQLLQLSHQNIIAAIERHGEKWVQTSTNENPVTT